MREGLVVCSLPPHTVPYDRPYPIFHPFSSPHLPHAAPGATPSHFAAGIAKLPADIRKYRERVFGGPRVLRPKGGKRKKGWGRGSRTRPVGPLVLLAGGIENFVKRGRRLVFGREVLGRGGKGYEEGETYLPSSLGLNLPFEVVSYTYKRVDNSTQCQTNPTERR